MIKVVYIAGTGAFGGASRSLYEALHALPEKSVEPYFIAVRGTALDMYRKVAKDVVATWGISRFDHSWIGHYRGTRWLILLRETMRIPSSIRAVLRAWRRWRNIDLIHVNEFLELGPALLAKALFKAPLVVHVRALVMADRRLWRTRLLHRLLRKHADAIIAIDESVRATLPADLPVHVIHNSFDARAKGEPDREYLAQLADLRSSSLKVGFIGNLLRHKGLTEVVEAASILKAKGEDVQFLIVGGSAASERGLFHRLLRKLGLAHNMRTELEARIASAGLGQDFLLLGPTQDIHRVIPAMDVLVFPSRLDAPGRPVIEAAFYGVPSIVAVREPRADTLIDGETGIAIPYPEPRLIADAILHFCRNRGEVKRMGEAGRALAERSFRPDVTARALLDLYERVAKAAVFARHDASTA